MTATVGGLVPTPPNNTTTFLRGDGTLWWTGAIALGRADSHHGAIGSLFVAVNLDDL